MTSRFFLLIGAGGFIGSIARYLTASWLTKIFPSEFPYGTFAVNSAGCLVFGIIYELSGRITLLSPEWRFFLLTGLCGGYTTFSSFALENIQLIENRAYFTFAAYSISSFVIGLLAVWGGITITKFINCWMA